MSGVKFSTIEIFAIVIVTAFLSATVTSGIVYEKMRDRAKEIGKLDQDNKTFKNPAYEYIINGNLPKFEMTLEQFKQINEIKNQE